MADLKDLNRRFYRDVFEKRNVDAIDDLLTEDVIEHEQPPPGVDMKPGREGVKQLCAAYLDGFNPLTVEVHEQYQDGDTVISRLTFHGTHSGTFAGMPATGKTISPDAIDIIRFEGDRMAEHWGQFDAVAMLTQLGAIPPMG